MVFNGDSYQRGGGGGEGAGRTSFENHMINYIPFLGMWKVYGKLQTLNK